MMTTDIVNIKLKLCDFEVKLKAVCLILKIHGNLQSIIKPTIISKFCKVIYYLLLFDLFIAICHHDKLSVFYGTKL